MRASPLEKGATSAYVVLQCTIQHEEKGELPNTTKDVTGNKNEKEKKKNKIRQRFASESTRDASTPINSKTTTKTCNFCSAYGGRKKKIRICIRGSETITDDVDVSFCFLFFAFHLFCFSYFAPRRMKSSGK